MPGKEHTLGFHQLAIRISLAHGNHLAIEIPRNVFPTNSFDPTHATSLAVLTFEGKCPQAMNECYILCKCTLQIPWACKGTCQDSLEFVPFILERMIAFLCIVVSLVFIHFATASLVMTLNLIIQYEDCSVIDHWISIYVLQGAALRISPDSHSNFIGSSRSLAMGTPTIFLL